MKIRLFAVAAMAQFLVFYTAPADVLELRNGSTLTGSFAGGSAGVIRFQTSQGIQAIETSQALTLTFTTQGGPVAGAAPPQNPPPASGTLSIPAGTTLVVRMMDGASSNDPKGKRFTTTLETDLTVQGHVVAKAGTRVYGRVENAQRAGRYAGQSALDLRLTELTVNGAFVPIVTGPYAQSGTGSMRKTARGAAAGATIGAIAGGGEGAGKGAAIGAVASGLRKGQEVVISSGTLLEFVIQQPVTVSVGA